MTTHLKYTFSADALEQLGQRMTKQMTDFKKTKRGRWDKVINIGLAVFISYAVTAFALQRFDLSFRWMFAANVILFAAALFFTACWRKRGGYQRWVRSRAGCYEWIIETEGITVISEVGRAFYVWPSFIALEQDTDYYYLHLRKFHAVAIPKAADVLSGSADITL